MLQSANIRPVYATGVHEPSDFFIEGLMNSEQFDLGLGYFRSTGFRILVVGFDDFIIRVGRMHSNKVLLSKQVIDQSKIWAENLDVEKTFSGLNL